MKNKKLAYVAVICALICILSPITLPIGPARLSLTSLILGLISLTFGTCISMIILTVYTVLGIIGLPVFSGFSAGIGHILGPTGGFIIGYFPFVIITSLIKKIFGNKRYTDTIALICGNLCLYIIGTLWFVISVRCSILTAIYTTILPYILFDSAKITLCACFVDRFRYIIGKK